MDFKDWLKNLEENLWGEIPSKQRKPSDGWGGKQQGMPMQPGMQQQGMSPQMMKKMKRKMKKK